MWQGVYIGCALSGEKKNNEEIFNLFKEQSSFHYSLFILNIEEISILIYLSEMWWMKYS